MLISEVLPLIDEAANRVYALVRETPLVPLASEGRRAPAGAAFAKLEQLQRSGSFKLRGATNKLMSLSPAAAAAGVIASSTGNHGLGVATAAKFLGIDAEVFLSAQVSPAKRDKIREHGARILIVGGDALAAELAARAAARESGRTYVSPYNDPYVVAGQGTIAVELVRRLPDLDAIFVATGGGGLISGVGSYLRHHAPRAEIIGCWPENSAVLYECLKAGRILDVPEKPTLSESTAGGRRGGLDHLRVGPTGHTSRRAGERGGDLAGHALGSRAGVEHGGRRRRRAGGVLQGGAALCGQDRPWC